MIALVIRTMLLLIETGKAPSTGYCYLDVCKKYLKKKFPFSGSKTALKANDKKYSPSEIQFRMKKISDS